MTYETLEKTAQMLVAKGKGILAADESTASANKRFAAVGVEETEGARQEYRGLLFGTPVAKDILSGVILYDETFWQNSEDGKPFRTMLAEKGILPGIKVDEGLVDLPGFPGEKVTKGLDNLPERLAKYRAEGAAFAKWRAVIVIGEGTPTDEAIGANTYVLARYARLCQEHDIVPIVEPEILFDGTHDAETCERVMAHVFDILFATMRAYCVYLPGAILKTSMVLPGKESGHPIVAEDVADRTVRVLHEHVPHELGGVVFLSGGQPSDDAIENLSAITRKGPHPWGITFSYSRALQDPVLKYWAADRSNREGAQELFHTMLMRASRASRGEENAKGGGENFVSGSQDL
jgi:fructose-bisphosphate aldolase class I